MEGTQTLFYVTETGEEARRRLKVREVPGAEINTKSTEPIKGGGVTLRIDKMLANLGYGSRKEVKKLLKDGAVTINEKVVKDAKEHVDPNSDTVTLYGEVIEYKEFIYLMMNKPPGVISATEDGVEKTVIDLLQPEDAVFAPFPVGRLDKDTEGLLLITNDGQLAHRLFIAKETCSENLFCCD